MPCTKPTTALSWVSKNMYPLSTSPDRIEEDAVSTAVLKQDQCYSQLP